MKWPGRQADHSPPSSANFKNEFTTDLAPLNGVGRGNFTFTSTFTFTFESRVCLGFPDGF